jgi:acetyl-CoA carboxylase biotin carboxylase subunit
MNTRLQVEHPVTEWVTGVDLVAWQLLLASGELKIPAQAPERRGAAIEVRLYAEDPQNFLPAPGPLGQIRLPEGAFVRTDTSFVGSGEVSVHYDPMIAKISVWAPTRAEAIQRLRVALEETRVQPPKRADGSRVGSLKSNLTLLRRLCVNPSVLSGETTTDLIAAHAELTADAPTKPTLESALATSLFELLRDAGQINGGTERRSGWAEIARREGVRS